MKQRTLQAGGAGQRGYSLVELMVAIALGLSLTAGVLQIFVSSKATYRAMEGLVRVQENGRFSIDRLARKMRLAGYMGCSNFDSLVPNNIVDPPGSVIFDISSFITGENNMAAGNAYNAVTGTDVITLRSASPISAHLTGNMSTDNVNIQIDSNPDNFQAGDILLITDCENADIFKATTVSSGASTVTIAHASNGNTTNRLSKAYQDNAMLMGMQTYTYSIQDTGRTDSGGNPVLSLFETPSNGATVEIIKGVEDIQITYGVDTDADDTTDRYDHAGNITGTEWEKIVSVRIALLISSAKDIGHMPHAYSFQGVQVDDPGDNRMRYEFTTTIGLRNRSS